MWWLSLLVPIGPILARLVIYLVEERGEEEKEMRAFCDVYIKSFEELLWLPEQKARRR